MICVFDSDLGCLAKFQRFVFNIIYNPFAVLFIIICILLNTLFMALDHHDMSQDLEVVLRVGNYVSNTYNLRSMPKIQSDPSEPIDSIALNSNRKFYHEMADVFEMSNEYASSSSDATSQNSSELNRQINSLCLFKKKKIKRKKEKKTKCARWSSSFMWIGTFSHAFSFQRIIQSFPLFDFMDKFMSGYF